MSETVFVRFSEYNDHEGESWDWWLQLTGNEEEISKLAALLDEIDNDDDPWHVLHMDDAEPESVVDKLAQYAGDGYYAAHNKVVGSFTCPPDLGEDAEALYKGAVRDFYLAGNTT